MKRSILLTIIFTLPSFAYSQDMPLTEVLLEGENWELAAAGFGFTEGPAVDRQGNLFFTDVPNSKIFKLDLSGNVSLVAEKTAHTNGLMFGPDGRLYGCRNGDRTLVSYDPSKGTWKIVVEDVASNDLVVLSDGGIYFTDPAGNQVWYVSPSRTKRVVAQNIHPNGVTVWRKESTLIVTESEQPHLWTFRVEQDGTLSHRERYYGPLALPSGKAQPGSDGMTVDENGRLYVASFAGLQMFDPTGRLGGVIAKPQNKFLSNVVFAGPQFDTLYVTCTDKVYRRKTKVAAPFPW